MNKLSTGKKRRHLIGFLVLAISIVLVLSVAPTAKATVLTNVTINDGVYMVPDNASYRLNVTETTYFNNIEVKSYTTILNNSNLYLELRNCSLGNITYTETFNYSSTNKVNVTVYSYDGDYVNWTANQSTGTATFYYGELENATYTLLRDGEVEEVYEDTTEIDYTEDSWSLHTYELINNTAPNEPTNPSPSDGATVSTISPTLSVDVSDSDNDSMNVSFYDASDDSLIATDTGVSNGSTASVTWSDLTLVDTYSWYAVADDGELTNQSSTWSFNVPGKLYLRNENNASEILNESIIGANSSVTLKFYGVENETLVTREVSGGVVNLTGLTPINFVVMTDLSGWSERRIYLPNIIDQDSIYLLNLTDYDAVSITFTKTDYTGEYTNSESVLMIQKAIEQNDTTKWRTVSGDYFGADGSFPSILELGERYRLVIDGPPGKRILGSFIPQQSRVVELEIGAISTTVTEGTTLNHKLIQDNDSLELEYVDETNETTQLNYTIYERNNESNTLITENISGEFGEYKATYSLNQSQQNITWTVDLTVTRNNETQELKTTTPGPDKDLGIPIDGKWLQLFGIGFMFLLAGLFSESHKTAGAITVALTGAVLWWIGLLTVGIGVVVLASVLAVADLIATKRHGGA